MAVVPDEDVAEPGLRQARLDRGDAPTFDLDRVVGDRVAESGPVSPEAVEDGQRERAVAGAVLAQDEPPGFAEPMPGLDEGPGDGRDRRWDGASGAVRKSPVRPGRGSAAR